MMNNKFKIYKISSNIKYIKMILNKKIKLMKKIKMMNYK